MAMKRLNKSWLQKYKKRRGLVIISTLLVFLTACQSSGDVRENNQSKFHYAKKLSAIHVLLATDEAEYKNEDFIFSTQIKKQEYLFNNRYLHRSTIRSIRQVFKKVFSSVFFNDKKMVINPGDYIVNIYARQKVFDGPSCSECHVPNAVYAVKIKMRLLNHAGVEIIELSSLKKIMSIANNENHTFTQLYLESYQELLIGIENALLEADKQLSPPPSTTAYLY